MAMVEYSGMLKASARSDLEELVRAADVALEVDAVVILEMGEKW
jgi:hypothetical protein